MTKGTPLARQGMKPGMDCRQSPFHACLLAAFVAVAGCQATGGQTLTRGAVFSALLPAGTAAASSSPTALPAQPLPVPQRLLRGEVRVPPAFAGVLGGTLVANAAGGLVGNNAGGLVGNAAGGLVSDAAGRHAASVPRARATREVVTNALAQQPLANVRVALVDARGVTLQDVAGVTLVTRTDAAGRYILPRPPEGRPARLLVGDRGDAAFGRLVAADLASSSSTEADVDLGSTLVARYCLEQYVSDQPDPEAALARVPAAIEADTVARTRAVVADAADLLAERTSLDSRTVALAVDRLQTRHEVVKTSFETLRKLLVVAGLSNLGDGEPATRVALSEVRDLLEAPDGGLYLNCPDDKRIWWLKPDGTLRALVGRVGTATADDTPDIGMVAKMTARPDGSLILLEEDRKAGDIPLLWRLTPRGTLQAIPHGIQGLEAALPLDTDRLLLISTAIDQMATFWELEAGGSPRRLSAVSLAQDWSLSGFPPAITQAALLPDGRVRLATELFMASRVLDIDPRTGTMERWFDGQPHRLPGPILLPDGRVILTEGFEAFRVLERPDTQSALQPLPRQFLLGWTPLLLDGSGRLVLAQDRQVLRLQDGRWSVIAGVGGQPDRETAISARDPRSFSVLPDGRLVIVDGSDLVLQRPGESAIALVPQGKLDPTSQEASNHQALAVVTDPRDGRIFVRANVAGYVSSDGPKDRIYEVAADGKATLRYETTTGIWAMAVGPDGDLYLTEYQFLGPKRVVAIDRNGKAREVMGASAPYFALSRVGFDQDGTLHLEDSTIGSAPDYVRTRKVLPIRDGEVQAALAADAIFPEAVDATGWFYEGLGINEGGLTGWKGDLVRRHRTTGVIEALTGPSGRFFTGSGVDDGVAGARDPVFGPDGDLYFLDMGNRQIKRIPVEALTASASPAP